MRGRGEAFADTDVDSIFIPDSKCFAPACGDKKVAPGLIIVTKGRNRTYREQRKNSFPSVIARVFSEAISVPGTASEKAIAMTSFLPILLGFIS